MLPSALLGAIFCRKEELDPEEEFDVRVEGVFLGIVVENLDSAATSDIKGLNVE